MDEFDQTNHTLDLTDQPAPVEDLRALLGRARLGDTTVLPRLRAILDANPGLWERLGDLAAQAERAWIELASGSNLLARESLARKLTALKTELAGPDPTPLERLLAERAAATWLQMAFADAAVAQARDVPLKQGEYLCRRQDAAQRRYLSALGALATLRRLLPRAAKPVNAVQAIGADSPSQTEGVVEVDARREIDRDEPQAGLVVEVESRREDDRDEPPTVALFPPSCTQSRSRRRGNDFRKSRKASAF